MSLNLINFFVLSIESKESRTKSIQFTSKYDDILFKLSKICRTYAFEVFDFSYFKIFNIVGK